MKQIVKYHFPCDNINLILNETLGVTFVLHLFFFYAIFCKKISIRDAYLRVKSDRPPDKKDIKL